jgi:hypothetical protein
MKLSSSSLAMTTRHTVLFADLDSEGNPTGEPSAANKTGGPVPFILTLNALGYGTHADQSPLYGRKNSDGNWYTITFPDDFVTDIGKTGELAGSTTTDRIYKDPFTEIRNNGGEGQIDLGSNSVYSSLDVTIKIPVGMDIGANSALTYVSSTDIMAGLAASPRHQGFNSTYGSVFQLNIAATDPCILLDLNTNKVTTNTLQNLTITIDNSANCIGAGGSGGFGGLEGTGGKGTDAGGGGGGGQGIHGTIPAGVLFSSNTNAPLVNQLDARPAGMAGLSGSYDPGNDVAGGGSGPAANGVAGSATAAGAGGAGGTADQKRATEGVLYPSSGNWGGSVVYLRSNTYTNATGTTVNIINRSTGFMFGGGGGGGGAGQYTEAGQAGGAGGALGESGSDSTRTGGGNAGGLGSPAGAILLWNTANVTPSNSVTNHSSTSMKGMDGTFG